MQQTDVHDEALLDEWARDVLGQQIAEGYAPRNNAAWLSAARRDLAEAHSPAHVARVVAGIRARRSGVRVTGWRHERGTHGISFVRDPMGTDPPPKG